MGIVIQPLYKEIINEIQQYKLDQFTKAVCTLESMVNTTDDDGDYVFDYSTMVRAILETYFNQDLAVI